MRKIWIGALLFACLVCALALSSAEQVIRDGLLYELEAGQAFAIECVEGAEEVVIHPHLDGRAISYERLSYSSVPRPRLVLADGIESVSGWEYNNFNARTIVLPQSLREIGENAFSGMRFLTELVIPEGVERLGEWAFSSGGQVTVSVPSTLASIDDTALMYLSNLQAFSVHPDNPNYRAIDGVLFSKDGRTLLRFPAAWGDAYTVPDGTVTIAEGAFGQNGTLTQLTLCEGIVALGDELLAQCEALEELRLPTTVSEIGEWTLPSALARLAVPAGNPHFREEGNAAFRTADSTLIFHASGTDAVYSVPAGTKRIGAGAFAGDEALQSVSLPLGLAEIGDSAFASCKSLAGISLPITLERIGAYAFSGCDALERLALPPALRAIELGAFYGCTAVSTVRIPAGVQEVGDYAFGGNPQMTVLAEPGTAGAAHAHKGKAMPDPLGMPHRELNLYYDAQSVIACGSGTDDLLSLYGSPDAASEVLGQFPNGTTAIVLDEAGEWFQVSIGFEEGYVRKGDVSQTEGLHALYTPMEVETSAPVSMMGAPLAGEPVLLLEAGERLYVTATRGTFYQVSRVSNAGNDEAGFVPTNEVRVLSYDDAERGGQYAVVQNPNPRDRLHLREQPSTDSRSLGRFFNGTQVELLSEQGDWYRVRVAGQEGYMMGKYVEKVYNQ